MHVREAPRREELWEVPVARVVSKNTREGIARLASSCQMSPNSL